MTLKRKVNLTIVFSLSLLIGTCLIALTKLVLNTATSEFNTYKSKNAPVFHLMQDYTRTNIAPLVRLETKGGQFFCSGTVISNDYVLTAAHCLMNHSMFFSGMESSAIRVVGSDGTRVEAYAQAHNQRADYALVRGDFKAFTKAPLSTDNHAFKMITPLVVNCGYPYGGKAVCYQVSPGFVQYYDYLFTQGNMFAGMSGGPVVDAMTGIIFAVNSAVTQGGIVVAPLVGIFESLGIPVEN